MGGERDSDERNEVGDEGTETVDDLAGSESQLDLSERNKNLLLRVTGFFLTCRGLVCPRTPSTYNELKNSVDCEGALLGKFMSGSTGEIGSGSGVSNISDMM